ASLPAQSVATRQARLSMRSPHLTRSPLNPENVSSKSLASQVRILGPNGVPPEAVTSPISPHLPRGVTPIFSIFTTEEPRFFLFSPPKNHYFFFFFPESPKKPLHSPPPIYRTYRTLFQKYYIAL